MLNSIIDTFINLDEENKNKLLSILSKVINPIKIYLIVVILLLLVMCISNYYICRKMNILENINLLKNT
jgi:hypothetical protein